VKGSTGQPNAAERLYAVCKLDLQFTYPTMPLGLKHLISRGGAEAMEIGVKG